MNKPVGWTDPANIPCPPGSRVFWATQERPTDVALYTESLVQPGEPVGFVTPEQATQMAHRYSVGDELYSVPMSGERGLKGCTVPLYLKPPQPDQEDYGYGFTFDMVPAMHGVMSHYERQGLLPEAMEVLQGITDALRRYLMNNPVAGSQYLTEREAMKLLGRMADWLADYGGGSWTGQTETVEELLGAYDKLQEEGETGRRAPWLVTL